MTDIRFLKDRVIFDGHAQSIEECDTITTVCDVLKNSTDFKTVKYENGYAEFEKTSKADELKFADVYNEINLASILPPNLVRNVDFYKADGTLDKEGVEEGGGYSYNTNDGLPYFKINFIDSSQAYTISLSYPTDDGYFEAGSLEYVGNGIVKVIKANKNDAVCKLDILLGPSLKSGYFTWNGAKRLVHADAIYNSDGTKKDVGVSFVEITSPSSASNGTLTQEQLDTLTASKNNKIIFDNEIYYCEDVQHDSGFLVYAHVGRDSTGNTFVKSIGITISTLGWVKVDLKIASTDYVDNKINSAIVTTLNTEV